MVAPALPWLWQAYRDTGHPLSPVPLRVLGVTLGVADPAMQWYQQRPDLVPLRWSSELPVLQAIFAAPGEAPSALGAPALLPLALLLPGLVRLGRRQPAAALALGLAFLSVVAFYFSGGMSVSRLEQPVGFARYVVMAVLISIPLGAGPCEAGPGPCASIDSP